MGTHYFWDEEEDNIIEEYDDAGETIATYATEPSLYGNVISQHRDGQTSYFHHDGVGSTVAVTDENGDITDTRAYSAFGETTESSGSTEFPYQYVGKKAYYFNHETEDYYVRARCYEPTIDRWRSKDPRLFVDGPNVYVYVLNNPAHQVDPSGLQVQGIAKKGGHFVGLDFGYIWCGTRLTERPFPEEIWDLSAVLEWNPKIGSTADWIGPAVEFSPKRIVPEILIPVDAGKLAFFEVKVTKKDLEFLKGITRREFNIVKRALEEPAFEMGDQAAGQKEFVRVIRNRAGRVAGRIAKGSAKYLFDAAAKKVAPDFQIRGIGHGQGVHQFDGIITEGFDFELLSNPKEQILKGKGSFFIGIEFTRGPAEQK